MFKIYPDTFAIMVFLYFLIGLLVVLVDALLFDDDGFAYQHPVTSWAFWFLTHPILICMFFAKYMKKKKASE